jgi:carbon-monoxide dehydrogenase medium subunit
MKPPKFTYHAPRSVEEALALLAEHSTDAKVLAGGQSLLPVMAMRLAAPAHLIDINRLDGLASIDVDAAGVTVGALVRHARLEAEEAVRRHVPIVPEALRCVAHPVIRNRGTTVGSLTHADPSAEMPAILALLGGSVVARSAAGERVIDAADFFVGPMESALRYDELAVAARFPAPAGRSGTCFDEITRRHGDYAMCGVGTVVTLDDDDRVQSLWMSFVSIGDVPERLDLSEVVAGTHADEVDPAVVGERAGELVDPPSDLHASADFRRHLAVTLARRTTRTALARARRATPLDGATMPGAREETA